MFPRHASGRSTTLPLAPQGPLDVAQRARRQPATVSAASSAGDELASAWNATVTRDPPASAAAALPSPSSLFRHDVITAGLDSSPSGITAKPHGRTATPLESCPSITGRRAAAPTGAYATVASQGLVLLSWRIHSPSCSPAGDVAA